MDTARLAKVMKALSHPKRLELFFRIAEKNEADFEAGWPRTGRKLSWTTDGCNSRYITLIGLIDWK